jgi:hypothetical protein
MVLGVSNHGGIYAVSETKATQNELREVVYAFNAPTMLA